MVGIFHSSVEIAYEEDVDGFGLISSDYATAGSDLLRVPRKAILSLDQARKSSFLKNAELIIDFNYIFLINS
ncbi:unnamed protein product [Onchocerca flexuosa]|uniref:CN hydrolase domain-containing protein n=1 Tax=Onchocerca flexuosa TaxID=387005 RepID=A0A183I5F6_9BILA|nr:unnamed protein product [Onchocerca flexuosa]